MTARFRIPITAITVFGGSGLLALTVGIVIFLGFGQAAESTRQLIADQAETLIDEIEQSLHAQLRPVRDQALWVADNIDDLTDLEALDEFMVGTLAATPQVNGIAVISANRVARRWHRISPEPIEEDWSNRPWIDDYLRQVGSGSTPAWRQPIFTRTVNASTLLHDIALRDADGNFIGVFAQIVSIEDFSSSLAKNFADTGLTPFILYDRAYVLAHPAIRSGTEARPLIRLEELGDLILERIWTPDEEAAYIQPALTSARASGLFWGEHYYLFIYRELGVYGPAPWTIGAHLNTSLMADRPGQRIMHALAVGLAVLLIGVAASILVGRKVSKPVKAIAKAAGQIDAGQLNSIDRLGGSRIRELDDATDAFNDMVASLRERQLIRDTLGRFVPEKVASSLLAGGGKLEVQQAEATILFCDIEAFTQLTESLGPVKIVEVLNAYFSRMVEILELYDGVVTQFQGDAILATFNVPVANSEHAANAVRAACDMLNSTAGNEFAGERLNIRIGINTGSVVAGAIGARGRLNYTVHGDAVNLAARLESLNKEYGTRILISDETAAQLSGMELDCIGETEVRGQTGSIRLYTPARNSNREKQ